VLYFTTNRSGAWKGHKDLINISCIISNHYINQEDNMPAFDTEAMDEAADNAREELESLPEDAVKTIAKWWVKWYLKAGHKRLGRIMAEIGKAKRFE
jgi:hypothetical protein